MKKLSILIITFLLLNMLTALGQDYSKPADIDLVFFYGKGCPHCASEEAFLEEMQQKYPTLKIHDYEVYFNEENRELMFKMAESFGTEIGGVPTIFIDQKVITGFSDALGGNIENEIRRCIELGCESPLQKINDKFRGETIIIEGDSSPTENPEKKNTIEKLTISAVLFAAAVDAINPCEFAVLIILLTTILAAGKKRRVLMAGLAFTASIYISYFLMGLGLFSAIKAAGLTRLFYTIVAVLAIVVGLFNLKDYLWYGKWFIMEVPLSWRPKMKSLIKSVTSVPGAFLIGFLVSLFLLPCTSGPYIVILGLLAKTATRGYAISLLLLYNFIFILPMLIITSAIYFGFTTTEKAEQWRTRKLKTLHLIAGIIMLLVGIAMFIAMGLGYV